MATRLNLGNIYLEEFSPRFLQEIEQKGDKGNKKALCTSWWSSFCTLLLAALERCAPAPAAPVVVQCNYCRHHVHPATEITILFFRFFSSPPNLDSLLQKSYGDYVIFDI